MSSTWKNYPQTDSQEPESRESREFRPQQNEYQPIEIRLDQSVAILIDGNNIEQSLHYAADNPYTMINFDKLVPALLQNRALSRLIYFREGRSISPKLGGRLRKLFHGSVVPCYKSAEIPLTIKAVQVAPKVDTIIILSGDADYTALVRHLKSMGVRVEIAAFPTATANVLRDESDYFFPITLSYSFEYRAKTQQREYDRYEDRYDDGDEEEYED
ncbi:MAG: NYN domain-containing protein [Bacteroidota bacterium]